MRRWASRAGMPWLSDTAALAISSMPLRWDLSQPLQGLALPEGRVLLQSGSSGSRCMPTSAAIATSFPADGGERAVRQKTALPFGTSERGERTITSPSVLRAPRIRTCDWKPAMLRGAKLQMHTTLVPTRSSGA